MLHQLLAVAPLAVFTFGALAFSVLTVFYWRERPGKSTVFTAFTLVCAVAFLDNLLFQVLILRGAASSFATAVILLRALATGLLPPLILHLVLEPESPWIRGLRWWRAFLFACYAAGAGFSLARALAENGLLPLAAGDIFFTAPAAVLCSACAAGLLLQLSSHRPLPPAERAYRNWIRSVLFLMLLCAVASLAGYEALVGALPDYLVLAFFSITLYYRERLVFFDLLVKRGAFLALGLALLTVCFAILPPASWSPWILAIGLLAFWLLGSWIYPPVARLIDRLWLRRPYTAADAERQFIREIQSAAGEDDLARRAAAALASIFQAPADVRFDAAVPPAAPDALTAALEQESLPRGSISLAPRRNGIPFLSDDRRLVQSLAGSLGVVLENVRFRADLQRQEQREQHLRWLASRAELKALRAQINPHFLFNALSVIAGLIPLQPELADEIIERLAQVFRYTLRKSETEWAPLAEEIDFVAAYLRIEQARFGERLRVEFDIEPRAATVPVPAMCIQPLIENAVRHGVSTLESGGVIRLRAALADDRLAIEISDTGPGFPPGFTLGRPGDGHGLRNVAERLRGYYGDSAGLSCQTGPRGACVSLVLPQTAARPAAVGEPS